jgi:peroxiredoxin Q/BCP
MKPPSTARRACVLLLSLAAVGGCSRGGEPSAAPEASAAPKPTATTDRRERPLVVGEPAPEFETVAHSGQPVRLRDLRGKVVILYFYPKDGTPGCTTEARQLAARHEALDEAGAVVLGVSSDDAASHQRFAEEHALPFLLLPDTDRAIAKAYGVGSFLGMNSRVTYVIDRQGAIARVYPSVDPDEHADQLLKDLAGL